MRRQQACTHSSRHTRLAADFHLCKHSSPLFPPPPRPACWGLAESDDRLRGRGSPGTAWPAVGPGRPGVTTGVPEAGSGLDQAPEAEAARQPGSSSALCDQDTGQWLHPAWASARRDPSQCQRDHSSVYPLPGGPPPPAALQPADARVGARLGGCVLHSWGQSPTIRQARQLLMKQTCSQRTGRPVRGHLGRARAQGSQPACAGRPRPRWPAPRAKGTSSGSPGPQAAHPQEIHSAPVLRRQHAPGQGRGPTRRVPLVSAQQAGQGACASRWLERGRSPETRVLPCLGEGRASRAHLGSRQEGPTPQGRDGYPSRSPLEPAAQADCGWDVPGRSRCPSWGASALRPLARCPTPPGLWSLRAMASTSHRQHVCPASPRDPAGPHAAPTSVSSV